MPQAHEQSTSPSTRRHDLDALRAVAMLLGGLAGVLIWRHILNFGGAIFEILPGMLLSFLAYLLVRATSTAPAIGKH